MAPRRPLRPPQQFRIPPLPRGRRTRRRPARTGAERTGLEQLAGLPAHARHRWVHLARMPQRRGPRGHAPVAPVQSGRAARHGGTGAGQRSHHRRGRLRQAHPGHSRRPSGSLGPHQSGRHHLVRCDVERVHQTGAPAPPSRDAADRRLLVVGGHRHGQLRLIGQPVGPDGPIHPGSGRAGRRHRRQGRRARFRSERGPGPGWSDSARLLQGRCQDGGHLPHHRRHPLLGPGRLRPGGPGRDHPSSGPGFGGDQHRRREGLPRRGRGSYQDRGRRGRLGGSGHSRRPVRRADRGRGGARPRGPSGRRSPRRW